MTNLEKEMLNATKSLLINGLETVLKGYNSPLHTLAKQVVDDNYTDLKEILDNTLKGITKDEEFKKILNEEFKRKIAKNLVGNLSGSIDKAVNEYKQNPLLKAKMITKLEEIIGED